MASDMAVFYNADEFAESVTYTAKGSAGVSITAIITRDSELLEPYVGRGEDNAMSEIRVQKTEVPTPQYGDKFTFGGRDWWFDPARGASYEDDNEWVIQLERDFVAS